MNMFNQVALKKPRYNKFDLSHDRKLSMTMGELIPIFVQDVLPGDRFRVDSETLIRMAPMLAPVMHRLDCWIHYFFVPNRLVWSEWESFITGGPDGTQVPVAPYFQIGTSGTNGLFNKGTLADYMGLPTLPDGAPAVANPVNVSALPFRAYQLIYDQYYRDQNLTPSNPGSRSSGLQNSAEMTIILRKQLRAWEKDYFTSALPWAQRGPEVTMPFEVEVEYKDFDQQQVFTEVGTPSAGNLLIFGGTPPPAVGGLTDDLNTPVRIENIESIESASVTINELRRSVRLQEWLEKNATGGARYVEQILAHFGVRSSDARLQRPEYLGGGKQPVSFSEVLSTYQTEEGAPQGNMAGHGISIGRTNSFARRFEEHGYVIGIMSVLPRTAYQQGVPRHFTRFDKFDYAWPEFAQIGEQEIKSKELWYDPTEVVSTNEETFGYQSRYSEYKYVPSTVHGEFRDTLDFWHMGRIFEERPLLNTNFVESDPTNRIFAVTAGQHLWCHVFNRVHALRPLPYFGTPIL